MNAFAGGKRTTGKQRLNRFDIAESYLKSVSLIEPQYYIGVLIIHHSTNARRATTEETLHQWC